MELQALPSRIGQVRRIVSAQLRYWHMDVLIDRASLGVTELLSNVHRHAQPDKTCTVEIELLLDRLKVSVHDHDPRLPVVADAGPLATCGRGLAMVAAMSESWGVLPDDPARSCGVVHLARALGGRTGGLGPAPAPHGRRTGPATVHGGRARRPRGRGPPARTRSRPVRRSGLTGR